MLDHKQTATKIAAVIVLLGQVLQDAYRSMTAGQAEASQAAVSGAESSKMLVIR